jgi:N-acetylglutamate synthase-like GNAT family acetyltransferase
MHPPIEIRQILFGTDEYKDELHLRDRVLRKPLGLNLFSENLTKEINDFHIGAFDGNVLIGVLILTVLSGEKVKMRQVGVEEIWRGKDVGARLVLYAEEFAKKLGYRTVVLNARTSVVGFYERLKYEKIGGEFIEVTIPHQAMQKKLG